MIEKKTQEDNNDMAKTGLAKYIIGYVLSVLLTLGAYFATVNNLFSSNTLLFIVYALAVLQLLVQLILFLHLGSEKKPRINLISFLFMVMVVVIIVLGSVWIMKNLHYNMTSEEAGQYIYKDEGYDKSE